MPYVDVWDVARAHLIAVEAPPNERYILVGTPNEHFVTYGELLHKNFSKYKYKIVHKTFGGCTFKIACIFLKEAA